MSTPRLYVDAELRAAQPLTLPPGPGRHVQVLRLQPGQDIVLFNGRGGEWLSRIERVGRRDVDVLPLSWQDVQREAATAVTLAAAMPANDRFDWLIEKATELGAAAVQPLVCERSVVRMDASRAQRRLAHWQGVAIAAAEQCGRTRLPQLALPCALSDWLRDPAPQGRTLLMLDPQATHAIAQWAAHLPPPVPMTVVSGPEGGFAPAEAQALVAAQAVPVHLGPRILRAETAPLAALVLLTGAR